MTLRVHAQIKIDTKKLKALPKKVEQAIMRGLQRGAFEVERRAKRYAPIDTGTLMRSIRTSSVKKDLDGFSISISPNVPYADKMEQPGRVRIRGRRPYMEPALKDSVPKVLSFLIRELKEVVR